MLLQAHNFDDRLSLGVNKLSRFGKIVLCIHKGSDQEGFFRA